MIKNGNQRYLYNGQLMKLDQLRKCFIQRINANLSAYCSVRRRMVSRWNWLPFAAEIRRVSGLKQHRLILYRTRKKIYYCTILLYDISKELATAVYVKQQRSELLRNPCIFRGYSVITAKKAEWQKFYLYNIVQYIL